MPDRLDLRRHRRIVVLTGAGVSAASGLATFRGAGGGWAGHDAERLAHVDALRERPLEAWRFFGALRGPVRTARPNAAHGALAQWESALRLDQDFLLVTQNIDGLHQRAGSINVVELHGNLMFSRCSNPRCGLPRFRDEARHDTDLPRCPRCGALLRPDVVCFGEPLPWEAKWAVTRALRECDLFVAVGTSGLVNPAADYVRQARAVGARTLLVNLEPQQEAGAGFDQQLIGPAEQLLPRLLGTRVPA